MTDSVENFEMDVYNSLMLNSQATNRLVPGERSQTKTIGETSNNSMQPTGFYGIPESDELDSSGQTVETKAEPNKYSTLSLNLQPRAHAELGLIGGKHVDMEGYSRLNAQATHRLIPGERRLADKIGETTNSPTQPTNFYKNDVSEPDEETFETQTADKVLTPDRPPCAGPGLMGEKLSEVDGYTRLNTQAMNCFVPGDRKQTHKIGETTSSPNQNTNFYNNDVSEPDEETDETQKADKVLTPDRPPRVGPGLIGVKHSEMDGYTRLSAQATHRLIPGERRLTDKIGETTNSPTQPTNFYNNDVSKPDEETDETQKADKDLTPDRPPHAGLALMGENLSKMDGYTRLNAQATHRLIPGERRLTDKIVETTNSPIQQTGFYNNIVPEPDKETDKTQKASKELTPDHSPRADAGLIRAKLSKTDGYTRLNAQAMNQLVPGEQRQTDQIGEAASSVTQRTGFYNNIVSEPDAETDGTQKADKDLTPDRPPQADSGLIGEKLSKTDGYMRLNAQAMNHFVPGERRQTDKIEQTGSSLTQRTGFYTNIVSEPDAETDGTQKADKDLMPDRPPQAEPGLIGEQQLEMDSCTTLNEQGANQVVPGEQRQTEKVGETVNTPIQQPGQDIYDSEHDELPVQNKNEADKDCTPELQLRAEPGRIKEKHFMLLSMISLLRRGSAIQYGCILLLAGVAVGAIVIALQQSLKPSSPGKVYP